MAATGLMPEDLNKLSFRQIKLLIKGRKAAEITRVDIMLWRLFGGKGESNEKGEGGVQKKDGSVSMTFSLSDFDVEKLGKIKEVIDNAG